LTAFLIINKSNTNSVQQFVLILFELKEYAAVIFPPFNNLLLCKEKLPSPLLLLLPKRGRGMDVVKAKYFVLCSKDATEVLMFKFT